MSLADTHGTLASVCFIKVLVYSFDLQKIRETKLAINEADVRLMQGVHLMWGLLNTGFTDFVISFWCVH